MLAYLTIAFVALYVIDAVFIRKYRSPLWIAAIALIFFSGNYMTLGNVDRILIFVPLGLIAGQVLFYLSLVLSKLSLRRALTQIHSIRDMRLLMRNRTSDVVGSLFVVAREELLWRCTIQQILGNTWPAVTITAVCFSLVHLDLREDTLYISHYLDLLVFSCILGILFHYFSNFYLVVAIHFVRNLNIAGITYRRDLRDAVATPPVPGS